MANNYDRIAPHYDAAMDWLDRWIVADLRKAAFDLLPREGKILEIGAGTGLNFHYYDSEAQGVATEPSREMIRLAKEKARPSRISLVESCAEKLPFVNRSFDAAIATLVFCSVDSPEQALAELKRVLRPGGIVVLVDHVRPKGLLGYLFDLINLISVPLFADHYNRRTAEAAQKAGLQIFRLETRLAGIFKLVGCRLDS
jgi:ubiquinone/menaquinone biosynthesis C-methylase UbiE